MNLRAYQSQDFECCVALFIEVFNAEPWNDEWTNSTATSFISDLTASPGFRGYVVLDEKVSVIGVILGRVKNWWRGREFFIDEFYVNSSEQGQGIGTHLLEFASESLVAEGIHNMTLLTEEHTPAYSFYQKQGFNHLPALRFLYRRM